MENRLTESIYLEPVTEKEIKTLISTLKDTATGFDDMNSMSFKISSEILVNWPTSAIFSYPGNFPESIENCKCHSLVQKWWPHAVW